MADLSKPLTNLARLPPIGLAAAGTLAGIVFGHVADAGTTAATVAGFAAGLIVMIRMVSRRRSPAAVRAFWFALMLCLGLARIAIQQPPYDTLVVPKLCQQGAVDVTATGTIESMPVVHRRLWSELAPRRYGPAQQTRFAVHVESVVVDGDSRNVNALCQVYVQAHVADFLSSGDSIRLEGRLDWPLTPGNPGEFAYRDYLLRCRIHGQLFVDSADDVEVLKPVALYDLRRLLGGLRSECYRILAASIDPDVRGIALALLLGSRHELPSELEHAFVASGTMHLLAISGLHVGILWMFVLQSLHLLLVPRRKALVLSLAICITYALLTDIRPSVLRATVFFVVFVVGQLAGRDQRMPGLLSVTALLMMMWTPSVVFGIGAWLSFLSVAALGWEAEHRAAAKRTSEVPLEALTFGDRLRDLATQIGRWLICRYRQMFFILLFTTPLIAATFHVVSLIGLVVNVVLIPVTGLILCVGFMTLAAGLVYPPLADYAGACFSKLLRLLLESASTAADIPGGHFFVADIPGWFVGVFYAVLVVTLLINRRIVQRVSFGVLLASFLFVLIVPRRANVPIGLRCTVLDVGQSQAVVLEFADGTTALVDPGSVNSPGRTSDVICNYLWHRGHRRLDAIVFTRNNSANFSALPGVVSRIPVDQVLIPPVANDPAPTVLAMQSLLREAHIPVVSMSEGSVLTMDTATLHMRCLDEVDPVGGSTASDQNRWAVDVRYRGRRIVLGGNIRRTSGPSVLEDLARADALLCPGHGSRIANPQAIADTLRPERLVMSSRNCDNRAYLQGIYRETAVVCTHDAGAATIEIDPDGRLAFETHRDDAPATP